LTTRDYKHIDLDDIDRRIAEKGPDAPPIEGTPSDVLYETLLDLLQLAFNEGMLDEEIDTVVRRVNDYRAEENRKRFTLHTGPGNEPTE
jgi:hypothetical protein